MELFPGTVDDVKGWMAEVGGSLIAALVAVAGFVWWLWKRLTEPITTRVSHTEESTEQAHERLNAHDKRIQENQRVLSVHSRVIESLARSLERNEDRTIEAIQGLSDRIDRHLEERASDG